MARAAGDSGTYDFVLRDKSNGRYNLDQRIEFDSVTTVIKSVLAAPQLVTWAYNHSLDVMSGLTDQMTPEQLHELCSDNDDLREYVKDNRLRPQDIRDEAADRGKEEHSHLEHLSNTYITEGPEPARMIAKGFAESANGFQRATGEWWLAEEPDVLASEAFVYSLTHRFAGTVDLILGGRVIVDLKSRRKGLKMYQSDDIQTGAYFIADAEMTPAEDHWGYRKILIIHDDGTYDYQDATIDPTAFLDLLQVFRKLKKEAA